MHETKSIVSFGGITIYVYCVSYSCGFDIGRSSHISFLTQQYNLALGLYQFRYTEMTIIISEFVGLVWQVELCWRLIISKY